jgi:outer membrane protein, multidrug efflux system
MYCKKMNNIKGIVTIIITAGVLLTSCKITQPYQRPDISATGSYRDMDSQDTTTIATVPWKAMFSDTLLLALIQEGINNNLDLQVATARIKQAQANYRQGKAALWPSVSANASVTSYQQTWKQQSTQTYELSLSASWEAEIWGKLSSTKRAYLMALQKSEAYKRAVQTQLVADIATYYYTLLAYDAQLRVTEQSVENRKQDVEAMKLLKESNVVTGAAVVQSEANRYSAEVTIPDIKQSIKETENSISVLLGRNPGSIARTALDSQEIEIDLKPGLPLQLLANRPDVQEAEYDLRYYTEMTNVARAYFYPTLTITAEGGFSNTSLSQLFNTSSVFSNLVGGLAQPLFNQRLNKQRLEVAKAEQEEYLATFRQTLLSASQEVSNALYKYQTVSEKITIRAQQIAFLEKSVEYTQELLRYTSDINYTDVLTSEQSLLSAQLSSISDKQEQLEAVVTLYRSLGGGWK